MPCTAVIPNDMVQDALLNKSRQKTALLGVDYRRVIFETHCYAVNTASIAAAASPCIAGMTCEYVSRVRVIVESPSISETSLTRIPSRAGSSPPCGACHGIGSRVVRPY